MSELPADPAYLLPWPTVDDPVSWAQFDDDILPHIEHSLRLACGRSRSALKEKHRQYLCFLFRAVKRERERRNLLII